MAEPACTDLKKKKSKVAFGALVTGVFSSVIFFFLVYFLPFSGQAELCHQPVSTPCVKSFGLHHHLS